MQIYSDSHGRVIWLTINPKEIRLDLQDLAPDFEYERTASVTAVDKVCEALVVDYKGLHAALLLKLENQMAAFDLFTEFLDNNEIHFDYFSG